MTHPAEYCNSCGFPFKQMGACPLPDVSIVWAYLSMVPYILPLLVLLLALLTRSIKLFKFFALLGSAYIVGDKLIKNLIRSPRPLYSCKTSFGMPSSHMAVMAAFAFERIRNQKVSLAEKGFWAIVTVAEGFARMQLNYHTLNQVIAGTLYGVIYSLLFEKVWEKVVQPKINKFLQPQCVEEQIKLVTEP